MSGRSGVVALLPVIAGAAVAIAIAAWFLRDGDAGDAPPAIDDARPPEVPQAARTTKPAEPPAPAPPPAPPPADRAPWATFRLVDASTRGPAKRAAEASLTLLLVEGDTQVRIPGHLQPRDDGAIDAIASVAEDRAARSVDLSQVRVRIRVPGYRAVEFSSRDALRTAKEIALQPLPVVARGVLVAGRGVEATAVWTEIFPVFHLPVEPPEDPPLLPTAFGGFELHDLTKGRWRLEARAKMPQGVLARATREFEVGAEPADLGEIRVVAPATLRARVVARDGTAVLDPGLAVAAPGDAAVAGRPGEDGWVAFAGLDPGATVKVASSLPGLEQEVLLPPDGGDEVRVELLWDEEGVRCRLRFLVDGSAPTRWGDIVEGPELDKGAWKRDGFLEHDMAPGDYVFAIQAEPVGKSGMRQVWAKFTVPRQPTWMADIPFSEEPPR